MTGDYSWTNSSKKYMELYEGLVGVGRFDHDSRIESGEGIF